MLPEDLITEILKRLPAKSLIRFKCTSKSWRSKIESPEFVKLHLTQSRNNYNNKKLILSIFRALDLIEDPESEFPKITKFQHPGTCHDCLTRILGCCDGLVAVSSSNDEIVIWNPYTRDHRVIAPPVKNPFITSVSHYIFSAHGLGHDSLSQDYKLVFIDYLSYTNHRRGFYTGVYSLKSNAWKQVMDTRYSPWTRSCPKLDGVQTNGALHWVATCNNNNIVGNYFSCNLLVLVFDLHKEEFRGLDFPDDWKRHHRRMFLDVVDGQLCAACCNAVGDSLDLWVMKEYGVKESWTILNRLDVGHRFPVWPVVHSRRGDRVLLLNWGFGNLEWFYPDKKSVEEVTPRRSRVEVIRKLYPAYCWQAWVLVESIVNVSTNGGR